MTQTAQQDKPKAKQKDHAKPALQNLKYIQKQLKKKTYKDNLPLLAFACEEAQNTISETPFIYTLEVNPDNKKAHVASYSNLAKRYKNRLKCQLHELHHELTGQDCNRKRCLVLLDVIIKSNMYRTPIQRKLNEFPVLKFEPQIKTLKI